MEMRKANIIFSKNGNGFSTTKITLPVGWVRELGASLEDKEVVLVLDNKKIEIIKKEEFNMKKWAVIRANDGMDEWMTPYNSKEEALNNAEKEWNHLTNSEKKHNTITVGVVNVNADGDYFEDECGNVDANIYEVALVLNGRC